LLHFPAIDGKEKVKKDGIRPVPARMIVASQSDNVILAGVE